MPIIVTEEEKAVARILIRLTGQDPDKLEPGDDPYHNNTVVIDDHVNGEPCHFIWREKVLLAKEVIAFIRAENMCTI